MFLLVKQFGHLSFCTFKDKQECGYGLYCSYDSSGSSRCLCSTERYWNTDKNYCGNFYYLLFFLIKIYIVKNIFLH